MSDHIFGVGPGHLPRYVIRRARKLGASVVNYTDERDNCGFGCRPFTCPKSRRHWFSIPESGIARQTGAAIIEQLTREGLIEDEGK